MGPPDARHAPTPHIQAAYNQAAQMDLDHATSTLKQDIGELVQKHRAVVESALQAVDSAFSQHTSEVNAAFSSWLARTTVISGANPHAPVELCLKCWAADRGKTKMVQFQSQAPDGFEDMAASNFKIAKSQTAARMRANDAERRPATAAARLSPAETTRPHTPAIADRELAEVRSPNEESPMMTLPGAVEDSPMKSHLARQSDDDDNDASEDEKASIEEDPSPLQKAPMRMRKRSSIVGEDKIFDFQNKTMLERLAGSKQYEYASITLILLNSFFIGFQTQFVAQQSREEALSGITPSDDVPEAMKIVSLIFNILFTADLAIRWTSEGFWGFLCSEEMTWNVFDIFIVATGLMDIGFFILTLVDGDEASPSVTSVARVLRIVRVAKIARIVRVLKFFRELRMMIFSIMASMISLVWVMLVLGLLFYIFGIVFTNGVLTTLTTPDDWLSEDNQGLIDSFGTLASSVVTLFMAMTGGNDWGEYFDNLGIVSGFHQAFFLAFIIFALFAVVNIVTGVFVDSAMTASSMDNSMMIQEEMTKKKTQLDQLRSAFEDLDMEGDGVFDADEFEERLRDERVSAYFQSMKLDVKNATTIFKLLDSDNSNSISIDEFVDGIWGLLGEASNLDSKIMQFEIKYVKEQIVAIRDLVNNSKIASPKGGKQGKLNSRNGSKQKN